MDLELRTQLEKYAHQKSIAFCYMCYIDAPNGVCPDCGSDDLMRKLPGVGVEYGYEWVIRSLISEELEAANTEEMFDQMLEDCYPESGKVGFLDVHIATAIKTLDPIAYRCAMGDYISSLEEDGELIEIGGDYYHRYDLESLLEKELEAA